MIGIAHTAANYVSLLAGIAEDVARKIQMPLRLRREEESLASSSRTECAEKEKIVLSSITHMLMVQLLKLRLLRRVNRSSALVTGCALFVESTALLAAMSAGSARPENLKLVRPANVGMESRLASTSSPEEDVETVRIVNSTTAATQQTCLLPRSLDRAIGHVQTVEISFSRLGMNAEDAKHESLPLLRFRSRWATL